MTSFLGISFSESLDDAQRRYPDGALETSPYGANALRLRNVMSGTVDYSSVIFEFADRAGMQLVIAHFTPSSAADVYDQLARRLGPPASSAGGAEIPAAASWRLPNQVEVDLTAADHRLVIVGPQGSGLKQDIQLRSVYGS